jgi:hypothetical protein
MLIAALLLISITSLIKLRTSWKIEKNDAITNSTVVLHPNHEFQN